MGKATPDNLNQYARLVGEDALFTVPIEWAQVVNRLANDPPVGRALRDRSVHRIGSPVLQG